MMVETKRDPQQNSDIRVEKLEPVSDWKDKFREEVRQRAQTGLSWEDYRAVMTNSRGDDE